LTFKEKERERVPVIAVSGFIVYGVIVSRVIAVLLGKFLGGLLQTVPTLGFHFQPGFRA
jgi:hypothetical protein